MTNRRVIAEQMAHDALHALGKEDLLFTHHGNVLARPEAYPRLADFFEKYEGQEPSKPSEARCEHADHPTFLYPVEVEYTEEKPDEFHRNSVAKEEKPAHYSCKIDWDLDKDVGFCETCKREVTAAEKVHLRAYTFAEFEQSCYEPHTEALIYHDSSIALTIYECCYTVWHRWGNGKYLYGPAWSKPWRLSEASCRKIWGDKWNERDESGTVYP